MRIGIDCRIFSPKFTGIGRYTKEMVEHFIKFNATADRPHEFILFFNKPEFDHFPETPHVQKILVNAGHYSLAEQTIFPWKLYRAKLDLMFFPHFNVPVLYRRPYLVTIHDLILSLFPGRKMTRPHHRFAYHIVLNNAVRKAKKIIAVSENTKKDIVNILKIAAQKVKVIYGGVSPEFRLIENPDELTPTLKKYNITKQFLLYTGVWRSHKNLPRLIEAFAQIKKAGPDLQLVITGRPDPHYPEMKHKVAEFALEKDVIFTGLVGETELIHLYNAALIYTFPSLYEGFGLPPLESMKCGTPVAASEISSIPEICGDGNAIFFDPENIDDIASKIMMIYKDSELQATLIYNGLRHANRFSWEKTAHDTYELLNEPK